MIEAFPLHWPAGYKRTAERINSRFKVTMEQAQQFLRKEIDRLGGTEVIVSTNIPVRRDGLLYADWMSRKIDDPGTAVYFKYKGRDVSMCCDQYVRIWENVYALGKGIEALRGMDRWGVSEFLDRVFTGFPALPESSKDAWHEVLGVKPTASGSEIRSAYYEKAKEMHPDAGGSAEAFDRLQKAYKQAVLLNKL